MSDEKPSTSEPQDEKAARKRDLIAEVGKGFSPIPARISSIPESELPWTAKGVLGFYSRYSGPQWPSYQTVSDGTGISRRNVISIVKKLVALGWLVPIGAEPCNRGSTNKYVVNYGLLVDQPSKDG